MPLVALLASVGGPVLESKHLRSEGWLTLAHCCALCHNSSASYRPPVLPAVFFLLVSVQFDVGRGLGRDAGSLPVRGS